MDTSGHFGRRRAQRPAAARSSASVYPHCGIALTKFRVVAARSARVALLVCLTVVGLPFAFGDGAAALQCRQAVTLFLYTYRR